MRLIDADELKAHYEQTISDYAEAGHFPTYFGIEDAIEYTEDMPTVNAEPAVHSQWIYPYGDDHTIAVCSNCKGVVYVNDAYNLLPPIDEVKYCYHCGARMNEVSE